MASSCGKHQSQYSHGHSRNVHAKTTHRVLEYVDTYGSRRQYCDKCGPSGVGQMSEISQSSRKTTVESNIKSEHNLHLACEDSPAFFYLHFLWFSSCPLSFYCTLTSFLSQCHQPSTVYSTRLCKTRTLRGTSRIILPVLYCQEAPFFPVLHR